MTKVEQDDLDVIRAESEGMVTDTNALHGCAGEQPTGFKGKGEPTMHYSVGTYLLLSDGTLVSVVGLDTLHGQPYRFYSIKDGELTVDDPRLKNLSFGAAIELAKVGLQVARAGWNGRGMFICYQKGYPEGIPINENTAKATGFPIGTVLRFDPYLLMYTAAGTFVPWLASQTDMLASDWEVVKPVLKTTGVQS